MKCFLVFCLVIFTNIFASSDERWEYCIIVERASGECMSAKDSLEDRYSEEFVMAKRTMANGLVQAFMVQDSKYWSNQDFFEEPECPCERHMIGRFTLCSTDKGGVNNSIENHPLHLSIVWRVEDGQLVHSSTLESKDYVPSVPIDEVRN